MLTQLNQLEEWLINNKSKIHLFPLIGAGYLFLFFMLMVSNVVAIIRWPLVSIKRRMTRGKNHSHSPISEMAINEANAEELNQILKEKELVLIDFWAEWCGPCIMMNKPLKRLAETEHINCTIVKVDTVKHGEVAEKYNVKGLPTLLLMNNNEELKRYAGALPYEDLKKFVST